MSTQKVVELPRRTMASVSPFTGELLREFEQHSDEVLEQKLQLAAERFRTHRDTPFAERARMMLRAAEILESEKQKFGELSVREMGKPLKAAIQEAEKSALGCRYYAENAERFLAREEAHTSATRSFVLYQPLGIVLAIMPWNFPFWQVFRFAVPSLLAGNVGLLKHAANVSGCSLAIEEIFRNCGFPPGVFQSLLIESKTVETVLKDPRVKAVTLTGSEKAGASVASIAGSQIKKAVLELGGSDALIVLADAELEKAAEVAVKSRMQNAGQSCIAAKRFIVEKSEKKQFTERV